MGAENHSEVKVVFHKGDLRACPTGTDNWDTPLQIAEFDLADRFALQCDKHLPGVWGLVKHNPVARGTTTLAGSNYVLSALILRAIRFYIGWLETYNDIERRAEMNELLKEALVVYGRHLGRERLEAITLHAPDAEKPEALRLVNIARALI